MVSVSPANCCWPGGARAALSPGGESVEGLSLATPAPGEDDAGVSFWPVGGPAKGRVRVVEDTHKALELAASYTLAVLFRAGSGEHLMGQDSLLLGHDNKHWLSLQGESRTLCIVDAETGRSSALALQVPADSWSLVFLQPSSDGTRAYSFDGEGLLEIGTAEVSLTGSRLRTVGWAANEVHVAQLVLWQRCITWGEMAAALSREDPPLLPAPDAGAKRHRSFCGRVVDMGGSGLCDVSVSWPAGGCTTDEDGCFVASLSDAETEVPETASSGGSSASSSDSRLSFSFARDGFAPLALPAQGQQSSLCVTLRPVTASATISADQGGSVTDAASGSSVTVPANGLTYPDGSPVSGNVVVSLSVIDATDPASLASMPGDFSAIAEDGSAVFLQSLGAAWVGARDEAGRELVVGPDSAGVVLDLKSTASADAEKLGSLPDMWSFDEASGKWELERTQLKVDNVPAPNAGRPAAVAETPAAASSTARKKKSSKKGKAKAKTPSKAWGNEFGLEESSMSPEDFKKLVAAPGRKSLSATVTKLGYINCDLVYSHPLRAVMLSGKVVGASGEPVAKAQLWSVGRDYQGRTPDVTDGEGKFGAMIAQFDSSLDVEVHMTRETSDDLKLEVYYEVFARGSLSDGAVETLQAGLCMHKQAAEEVNGLPSWSSKAPKNDDAVPRSKVSWCRERHRWEHSVDGKPLFVREEAEDPPALPFGPGWRVSPSFLSSLAPLTNLAVPVYSRARIVEKKSLGPFRTGPPGELVDLGELMVA